MTHISINILRKIIFNVTKRQISSSYIDIEIRMSSLFFDRPLQYREINLNTTPRQLQPCQLLVTRPTDRLSFITAADYDNDDPTNLTIVWTPSPVFLREIHFQRRDHRLNSW